MPGVSEVYEQSLLTANTVWRKLTRPVFRPGRTPSLRGPLVRKIPTAAGSSVLQSEWSHRPDEESSIDEPRRGMGVLSGGELSLGGAHLGRLLDCLGCHPFVAGLNQFCPIGKAYV